MKSSIQKILPKKISSDILDEEFKDEELWTVNQAEKWNQQKYAQP